MTWKRFTLALFVAVFSAVPHVARGAEAAYHHVHLNVPNPEEGAQW